jgi:hypothetical protein
VWPDWLTTVLELAAVALIVAGVALIFIPAAFIVGGLALGAISYTHADAGVTTKAAE